MWRRGKQPISYGLTLSAGESRTACRCRFRPRATRRTPGYRPIHGDFDGLHNRSMTARLDIREERKVLELADVQQVVSGRRRANSMPKHSEASEVHGV